MSLGILAFSKPTGWRAGTTLVWMWLMARMPTARSAAFGMKPSPILHSGSGRPNFGGQLNFYKVGRVG